MQSSTFGFLVRASAKLVLSLLALQEVLRLRFPVLRAKMPAFCNASPEWFAS